MKPLKLTIAGLNSFKGEQEIDFEKLSDLGMFGIFGPTGSGKSSILDAMTLALFGTVVRAERNKQGIINHAETKLNVSFTFALGAGEQRKHYRIDRAYKTKDHVSVQNVHSRLVDVTGGGNEIIAERETEVTQRIERLLGMKAEDFTRAVVLPQGSFADFLKMETSKRRAMLERLFSLEKYGRQLSEKLSGRYETVNTQFNRLDAEQQSLGDASGEAVQQSQQRQNEAREAERQAAEQAAKAVLQYEQGNKLYSLQQELAAKQAALAELRQQDASMELLRQEVRRAEEAGQVLPLLEERDAFQRKVQSAEEECDLALQKVDSLAQQAEKLAAALRTAKSSRAEQEPALLARKARLDSAQALEQEVQELATHVQQVSEDIAKDETALAATIAQIEAYTRSLIETAAQIAELEKQAEAYKVSAEYRQLLQGALSMADKLEREIAVYKTCHNQKELREKAYTDAVAQRDASEKRTLAGQEAIAALKTSETEAKAQCPADETALTQREIKLAELKSRLKELTAQADKVTAGQEAVRQGEAELKNAIEEQALRKADFEQGQQKLQELSEQLTALLMNDRQAMAAKLAAGLTSGQPCPVCGSDHHPRPALFKADSSADAGKQVQLEAAMEALQLQLKTLENAWRQAEGKVISLQAKLDSIRESKAAVQSALSEGLAALTAAWQTDSQSSLAALREFAQLEEQRLLADKEALKRWRSAREAAETRLRELEQQVSQDLSLLASHKAVCESAAAERARCQREWEEAMEQAKQTTAELGLLVTQLGEPAADARANIKAVVTVRQAVADRDRKVEQLQQQLSQKRAGEQKTQQQREELRRTEQQLVSALTALRAQHSEWVGRLAEKRTLLHQITQGIPVGILLTQAESSISALRKAEQTAQEQFDANQSALEVAKQQATIRRTQLQGLKERLQEMAAVLEKRLLALTFESETAVREAYRNEALLERKRQELKNHADQETKLTAQCEELISKLAGQSISEIEWNELIRLRSEALQAKDQATEQRIAAEQACSEVAARHKRWQELEDHLVKVRLQLQHLDTLKKMVRGNLLVEFMAQEQMDVVVRHASDRLKQLTNNRYALELASDGSFIIRDDDNAGARRPVNMLSGGETFQTSLALALALSTQIQLKGQHPLEFFFLDEGFGSLDQKLLEVVISSLERLPLERMTIGLISHVEALQQRMLRRLIVEPAEPNGKGTQVRIEIA